MSFKVFVSALIGLLLVNCKPALNDSGTKNKTELSISDVVINPPLTTTEAASLRNSKHPKVLFLVIADSDYTWAMDKTHNIPKIIATYKSLNPNTISKVEPYKKVEDYKAILLKYKQAGIKFKDVYWYSHAGKQDGPIFENGQLGAGSPTWFPKNFTIYNPNTNFIRSVQEVFKPLYDITEGTHSRIWFAGCDAAGPKSLFTPFAFLKKTMISEVDEAFRKIKIQNAETTLPNSKSLLSPLDELAEFTFADGLSCFTGRDVIGSKSNLNYKVSSQNIINNLKSNRKRLNTSYYKISNYCSIQKKVKEILDSISTKGLLEPSSELYTNYGVKFPVLLRARMCLAGVPNNLRPKCT